MKQDEKEYKEVFKSTFLFAFVRVFQMLVGIVRNKLVAIILGPSGIGVIELYTKTTELVKKGAGLGVSQSALRDISSAKAKDNIEAYYKIMMVTKRVVTFTSLFGLLVTVLLSPLLSCWTFGDSSKTIPYSILSLVVFFTIRTEIQTSILKGVRAQRHLAISNMIGAIAGLVVSVPIYYIWGEKGIVPALIINAAVAFLCTNFYVNKIQLKHIKITWKEIYTSATPMIKVGVLLMAVGILDSIIAVVLSSFLRLKGGLDVVGFYHTGHTFVVSYIGIIASSLIMDYYPRLSAVYDNNAKITDELNKQTQIGLLFILPLASIFVFLTPQLIEILYTKDFLQVLKFTDFAIYGAVFNILAECMMMILVAKQTAILYLILSFVVRAFALPTYMLLFSQLGLTGLGIAYFFDFFIRVVIFSSIIYNKYKITFDNKSVSLSLITLSSIIVMYAIRHIGLWYIKYSLGIVLILAVTFYTNKKLKQYLGLSLVEMTRKKILKNKGRST